MFHASFFAACKYGHADNSFGYTQFDVHEKGFIIPLPASLMKGASKICLSRLITLYGSDPDLSFLELERSSQIDWDQFIGDDSPILG